MTYERLEKTTAWQAVRIAELEATLESTEELRHLNSVECARLRGEASAAMAECDRLRANLALALTERDEWRDAAKAMGCHTIPSGKAAA